MEKNLTFGLESENVLREAKSGLFTEEESISFSRRVAESYTSLLGAGLGGGLFLVVVMAGVVFWFSRERAVDQNIAEEAEKFQEARRKAQGFYVDERKEKYIIQDFGLFRFLNGRATPMPEMMSLSSQNAKKYM